MPKHIITLSLLIAAAVGCQDKSPEINKLSANKEHKPEIKGTILDNAAELQERAYLSGGGAMGCGIGFIELQVGDRTIKVRTGLDPIHVFGKRITIEDLKLILKSRVDSYTNEKSPLNGNFDSLCYVTLETIKYGLDPSTLPILEPLLKDSSGVIKGWATMALLYMADNDAGLKEKIENIVFPSDAIGEATGRGANIPNWVNIEPKRKR